MNIETKSVRGDVADYLKFGWKHTDDHSVRSGRTAHTEHILARDKDMPNYRLIAALESKYFGLKASLKTYNPMDPLMGFLAFLIFIFPFIIYALVKRSQKQKIQAWNGQVRRKMNVIVAEVEPLL